MTNATLDDIITARAEALALVQRIEGFSSIPYFVLRKARRVSNTLDRAACGLIIDDRAATAAANGDEGDE